MKEAIKEVIKDLEDKAESNINGVTVSALKYAIRKLKGVLAQHEIDNTNRADGNGENDGRHGQTD